MVDRLLRPVSSQAESLELFHSILYFFYMKVFLKVSRFQVRI